MKVTVLKDDLVEALERVRWTVAGSKMIQLHQCFCFRDSTVAAYNGMAGTVTNLELGGADFAVPAEKFFRLVSSLFDEITLQMKGATLHLYSGQNESQINTIPTKTFPTFAPTSMDKFCTAPNLLECLKSVAFTVSSDATKPELMGVAVRGDKVYSCDINRITRATLQEPSVGQVNIPAPAVEHIVRLGAPDMMFTSGTQIGVLHRTSNTIYVSTTLAKDFPYDGADRAIGNATGQETLDLPSVLSEAISRVIQLSDKENTEVIIEGIKNGEDGIRVTCRSEQGRASEFVHCPIPRPFRFAVRPGYFTQAMGEATQVDLTDVLDGRGQAVRFFRDGFDHTLGLMAIPE